MEGQSHASADLKVEEGAVSQGRRAAFRSWHLAKKQTSPRTSTGNKACPHPALSPVKLISDFWSPELSHNTLMWL